MILENIDIKIGNHNQINYYKEKGFDCKLGDMININPILLPIHSHIRIKVKCQICNSVKMIIYPDYLKCIKNQNFLLLFEM